MRALSTVSQVSILLPDMGLPFCRTSSVPKRSTESLLTSKKRSSAENLKPPVLPAVDETSCDTEASLCSSSSVAQLPPAASPTSANTSPVAVPPKRQHTSQWETTAIDQPDFVPPHLLSAQTMPTDFVYALGSRPVCTSVSFQSTATVPGI